MSLRILAKSDIKGITRMWIMVTVSCSMSFPFMERKVSAKLKSWKKAA